MGVKRFVIGDVIKIPGCEEIYSVKEVLYGRETAMIVSTSGEMTLIHVSSAVFIRSQYRDAPLPGDVIIYKEHESHPKGHIGIVVDLGIDADSSFGVDFGLGLDGHDLGGAIKTHTGWYMNSYEESWMLWAKARGR